MPRSPRPSRCYWSPSDRRRATRQSTSTAHSCAARRPPLGQLLVRGPVPARVVQPRLLPACRHPREPAARRRSRRRVVDPLRLDHAARMGRTGALAEPGVRGLRGGPALHGPLQLLARLRGHARHRPSAPGQPHLACGAAGGAHARVQPARLPVPLPAARLDPRRAAPADRVVGRSRRCRGRAGRISRRSSCGCSGRTASTRFTASTSPQSWASRLPGSCWRGALATERSWWHSSASGPPGASSPRWSARRSGTTGHA